jgi:hypothetical protein
MYEFNGQKYTLEQVTQAAIKKGYTLQELLARNPELKEIKPEESGKVQSVSPGAIAETIAAPEIDMDLPSEDTSLDLQKIQREFDRGKFKTAEKEAYENYKLTGELDANLLPEPEEQKQNTIKSLASGVAQSFLRIPAGISDLKEGVTATTLRAFYPDISREKAKKIASEVAQISAPGLTKYSSAPRLPSTIEFAKTDKKLEKNRIKLENESFSEAIEKGNFKEAAYMALDGTLQTVPSMLLAMTPGGIAVHAASITGEKFEEEYDKNPEKTTAAIWADAAATGVIEGVGDYIFRSTQNVAGKILGKGGPKAASDAAKYLRETTLGLAARAGLGSISEGGTELAQAIATKAVDKAILDKDFKFSKYELLDNFLLGTIAGGAFTGANIASQKLVEDRVEGVNYANSILMPEVLKQQIRDNTKKMSDLTKLVESEDRSISDKAIDDIEIIEDNIITARGKYLTGLSTLTNPELRQYAKNKDIVLEAKDQLTKDPDMDSTKKEAILDKIELAEKSNLEILDIATDRAIVKNTEKLQDFTKDTGVKVKILKTEEEARRTLEDLTKQKRSIESLPDGFRDSTTGDIYINIETAKKTKAVSVASHEFLHGILANTINQDPKAAVKLARGLMAEINKIDPNQLPDSEFKRRLNLYKGRRIEEQAEEVLTLFSDALLEGQLVYDDKLFAKAGNSIRRLLQNVGYKQIKFDSGRDVYNFIKDYNQSFKTGIFKGALKKALEKPIEGKLIDKPEVTVEKPSVKESRSNVKGLLDKYDNKPKQMINKALIPTDDEFSDYRTSEFGREIMPIVETITKRLFDKIPIEATRVINENRNEARKEYQNALITEAGTMVANEFKPEALTEGQTIDNFISNRLNLRANDLAARLGVEETIKERLDITEEEGPRIQVAAEYADYSTVVGIRQAEKERIENLIDPLKILDSNLEKEYLDKTKEGLENLSDEKLNDLTFGKIKSFASDVTARYWGITEKKVTTAAANLATYEIPPIQKIIYDNVNEFILLLPEGAITEGMPVSEALINTGLNIPRKLQQAFYDKVDRTTKGAGLIPFKLKDRITKEDFLKTFGINTDGTTEPFGGKDPRAQALLAFIRLHDRILTNTAIRRAAEFSKQQESDIRAGISDLQFSFTSEQFNKALSNLTNNGESNFVEYIESLPKNQGKDLLNYIDERRWTVGVFQHLKGKNKGIKYENHVNQVLEAVDKKDIKSFKVTLAGGNNAYEPDLTIEVDNIKVPIELKLNDKAQMSSFTIKSLVGGEYSNKIINNTIYDEIITKALLDNNYEQKVKEYNQKGLKIAEKNNLTATIEDDVLIADKEVFEILKSEGEQQKLNINLKFDNVGLIELLYNNKNVNYIQIGGKGLFALGENKLNLPVPNLNAEINLVIRPTRGTAKKTLRRMYFRAFPSLSGEIFNSDVTLDDPKTIKPTINKIISSAINTQESRSKAIDEMVERKKGIAATTEISELTADILGKTKGRFKFFVPPSADDFAGLMYYLAGKGRQGDADLKFFKENLFDPFAKGINAFESYKQNTLNNFREFKKAIRKTPAALSKKNSTGLTNEAAVRVYLWNKKGIEIPGITETEIKNLVEIVEKSTELKEFASLITNLTLAQGYPEPSNDWWAGSMTIDILDSINTEGRDKFLSEFNDNIEEIFGKVASNGKLKGPIANKLKAAFGQNYLDALSDSIYRMQKGRAREFGKNKLTGQLQNWINDSVGAIMFFNVRSALLQQISTINFINLSDNNPLKVAKTIADPKQFWTDYATIFNSDFLKQRRAGLKTDVNADEIAQAAESGKNPIRSAIAVILKKGFLPTQMADSHAISLGGASFYRNRVNTYLKEGLELKQAEEKAFLDFQEIAEESQQSSRPDRISMQQASPLGRIILAFANTPMQYARLMKKAALDLKNKRGDTKTNLAKLAYYGIIQNMIFTYFSNALFALGADEEEEEEAKKKYYQAGNNMADSLLRGLGFGGAAVSAGKNMVLEAIKQYESGRPDYTDVGLEALTLSPPIDSKITKLQSAGRTFTYRQSKEKIRTEGISLDNPIFEAVGKVISALTNVPLDRVVRKLDNLTTPIRQDVELWQAISLALGYSKWDVGLKDTKEEKKVTKEKPSPYGLRKVKIKGKVL